MNAVPWVKWFMSDFLNGIADMDPYEICLYAVVLNLIYDKGGPIQNDPGKIARRCNMRKTTAEGLITRLVIAGKLTLHEGVISNKRCLEELSTRRQLVAKASANAQTGWSKRREKLKENNDPMLQAHTPGMLAAYAIQNQNQKEKEKALWASKKALRAKPKIRRQLPEDFLLTPELQAAAAKCGMPARVVGAEFERFADHHRAKGTVMLDWAAAWRTWCHKAMVFAAANNNGNLFGAVPPPPPAVLSGEAQRRHWENQLTIWQRNGWNAAWGPKPLEPGCSIPASVVQEWRQKERAA